MQKKPQNKKQLPKDVIDHWPEVFKDVHIDVVPLEYLNSVRVEFTDGKIWDIDINTDQKPVKDLEKIFR